MASKPSVTLTLAGDEKRLTESFDKVGAASKSMADKVDSSSKDMQRGGERLDGLTESADTAEGRFTGFADVLGGTTEAWAAWNDESLSTTERLQTVGMALADLSGGIAQFLLPMMGNLADFMKGGLASAMTFISAHPLLITVGLLAAAFVLLWMNSEKFRDIAIGVFNAVGGFARDVLGGALNWVISTWGRVVDFFGGLPGRIGDALGSLGGFIERAFKGGLNKAIEFLNWGIDRINSLIYGVNVLNPFENIPYIPHVPRLHTGGVFHSADGRGEGLALLRDGERVSAPGQGGSGGGGGYQISVPLVEQIQAWFNDGTLVLVGR